MNYDLAISRGVRLNPNIQYVVNPDNLPRPKAFRQSNDILVFGAWLSVDFAALLGMPAQK
ncbi:hypothetical protein D0Z70_15805 [Sphingobium terrigena]|uniref:Uncharacterized protein n=1 Tax=Sphingobium terrigena TaxID=2304063 RepID=A0A418YPY0_9SPHN|nr:hypothetical protein D0Z70_15805 [Sphingobium terrigena]